MKLTYHKGFPMSTDQQVQVQKAIWLFLFSNKDAHKDRYIHTVICAFWSQQQQKQQLYLQMQSQWAATGRDPGFLHTDSKHFLETLRGWWQAEQRPRRVIDFTVWGFSFSPKAQLFWFIGRFTSATCHTASRQDVLNKNNKLLLVLLNLLFFPPDEFSLEQCKKCLIFFIYKRKCFHTIMSCRLGFWG